MNDRDGSCRVVVMSLGCEQLHLQNGPHMKFHICTCGCVVHLVV